MRISAKEAVYRFGIDKLPLFDLVNGGKITVYDKFGDVVTLAKHQNYISERRQDYTPVDFSEYTDAFDFGDTEDSARAYQMKYEEEKRRVALQTIEYDYIIDNYYFERDELRTLFPNGTAQSHLSVETYEMVDGKYIIPIKSSIWVGKTPEMIYEAMKGHYQECVIVKVLMDKKDKSFTKLKVGELFYEDDDASKHDSTFRDKVDSLINEFDKQYVIDYE